MMYRNLVNFRATNFSILIVRCGYSSRFRFTHEILSPCKKNKTIITYLPGHVNAYVHGSLAHRTTLYHTLYVHIKVEGQGNTNSRA